MVATVFSASLQGLEASLVEVETDILNGLPKFNIVGLPDKAVEESKERVRSALKNSSADLPARRITVNLAPGDLPKEGPLFDLPIAISLLIASGQLKAEINRALFIGELSLNGNLRHTKGILPIVLFAKKAGFQTVMLPIQNADEARVIDGVDLFAARSLKEVYLHLSGQSFLSKLPYKVYSSGWGKQEYEVDMLDIKGQDFVKRAVEVAVAGGHNILLKGPPGSGKTMIAKAIPSILPPLTFDEALEVTNIYSVSNLLKSSIVTTRPFRSPHHTTSHIGLIGGSADPKPGEISLAHRGVLFLDEFPEFPRQVIESMRQPMEDGKVVISRAKHSVEYPSKFMLVAAANPCPCGYFADKKRECTCTSSQILRYQKRISGPILDRIDIHIDVPAVEVKKIAEDDMNTSESSGNIQKRIIHARETQHKRFAKVNIVTNGEMSTKIIKTHCRLTSEAKSVLEVAMSRLSLTARSYYKVIKVSQTISDLENEQEILKRHILEALQYRPRQSVI